MPIALTILLIVTAFLPVDPIRDAVDRGPVGDARLERSSAYAMLGPVSSMLDAMTLFTVGQIYAFTAWWLGVYAAIRVLRRRRAPATAKREVVLGLLAFVAMLVTYGAAVILPRPMARLVVTRIDVIAVDFHSHTRYSHDGRAGWSAADLRDWHTAAGYDVAYVTDHRTYDGVVEALALDPALAGQGTVLLPGLEAFFRGEHVNILNAGVRYKGLTTADFREVDEQSLLFMSMIPKAEPVLVETIPGDLSKLSPAAGPQTAGIRAIEIVDGSPRGMSQTRRDHARIVHLADSLNLALVAGTDNHGWGRTAPGWTLMRVTDWRGYAPDSLAGQMERVIRSTGRGATKVVERTTADASPVAVALTMPAVLWTVMRTLSPAERIAWAVWTWGVAAIVWLIRRRRASPGA